MGKLKISSKIGALGEDIACRYLEGKGFSIVDRNWRENWGEIDIVAKKDKRLYFFEVKSMAREFGKNFKDEYRPEENVHPKKLERLSRVIQTYLEKEAYGGEWNFGVLAVSIDEGAKKAKVEIIQDILS